MTLFLITLFLWMALLFFIRPTPSDLKAKIPNYWESFTKIQATFWLGIVLILTFLLLSDGTFHELNDDWFKILGVNNLAAFTPWWFVQTVTQNFIHINWLHLWANLSFLGILSLYERNVGAKRFLIVFLISGMLSSVSILFYASPVVAAGASAGLFGLAAAYLLDNPKLTRKEDLLGFAALILFWLFSCIPNKKMAAALPFHIDIFGHLFGLIFGAVFCKIFPRKAASFDGQVL